MKSKLVPVFVAALLGIGLPLGTSGPASATPVQNNAPPPFPSVGAGNYYKVDYPGSTVEGELKTPVTYLLWIPDGVTQLRGLIVHQHGAGTTASIEGSTGAYDLQWQALAKKWDCALWSSSYHVVNEAVDLTPGGSEHWFDPRRGSEKTFLKAIDEFAAKSEHPELSKVPWILWGHSGGGIWADVMTDLHPDRVVVVWMRSGSAEMFRARKEFPQPTVPEAAYQVPEMGNPGAKETGPYTGALATFKQYRAKGAPVGFAPDPRTGHECGDSRYLAIPYLDACMAMRLPDKGSKDQKLKPVDMSKGWLAKLVEKDPKDAAAVPAAEYKGNVNEAVWLPNEAVAKAWVEYVKTGAVSDTTPPPAPTDVKTIDRGGVPGGYSLVGAGHGTEVTWIATADFESGIKQFIILRDGKELAIVGPDRGQYGRPIFQGMTYHDTPVWPLKETKYLDATAKAGEKHTYTVITVNGVGLKSPPSDAAKATQPSSSAAAPSRADSIEILKDIVIGTGGGRALHADIARPKTPPTGLMPAVLWIHGGGWTSGSHHEFQQTVQLANHGYLVLSVEYRFVDEAIWPAQIEDCKLAVRWLRANAAKYQVNPDRIGCWGTSAGGHLAALMGVTGDKPDLEGKGGSAGFSSAVQAVVDFCGPTDFKGRSDVTRKMAGGTYEEKPEIFKQMSPLDNVNAKACPYLIVNGEKDTNVPLFHAQRMTEALQKVNVPVELIIVKNAGHGYVFVAPPGGPPAQPSPAEVDAAVLKFLDANLKLNAQNLRVSIYADAADVNRYLTTPEGREKAAAILQGLKISKIFLEGRREDDYVPPAVLREIRDDFLKRGFRVCGGVMFAAGKTWAVRTSVPGGLPWLNYEAEKTRRDLAQYFTENAAIFDEIIIDDMFATDDTSPDSDRARGKRSWGEYRRDLLVSVIEPFILKPARAVRPSVRVIIKYPQWYENFHNQGYDPPRMSALFDETWAGTETRDPRSVQPTEGYINYRWAASVAGKKINGGWFDWGGCTPQTFVDQAYQTVLAGAPEFALWHLGDLMKDNPCTTRLQTALPELFELADKVHGRPLRGISYYMPAGSDGAGNLYLADDLPMMGLPIVPESSYPAASRIAILPAHAADDPQILAHMKQHLSQGATLVLTPAFLNRAGKAAAEMAGVSIPGKPQRGTAGSVEIEGKQVKLTTPLEIDPGLESPADKVLISASGHPVPRVGDRRIPLLTSRATGGGHVLVLNVAAYSRGGDKGLAGIPQALADKLRGELLAPLGIQLSAPTKVSFYLWGDASFFYNFRDEPVELMLNQKPVSLGAHRVLWR